MAEILHVPREADKKEVYAALLPQVRAVVTPRVDIIANMANVAAMLKESLGFHWVGFYRVLRPGLLVLGPFQGPLACVEIPFGKGVCGHAATTCKTVIVPDVDAFPGHIACSSLTRSEIVVPCAPRGETLFVLDVDSDRPDDFDAQDQAALEDIVAILAEAAGEA